MNPILLKNGYVLDVVDQKVIKADVLIENGVISEIKPNLDNFPENTQIHNIENKYISPGFIESHLHIESSMMPPLQFCNHAVRHGTTTVMVDPHEIANVAGMDGMKLWLEQADLVPIDMYVAIPSCVPATHMENSGATLGLAEIEELITNSRIYGLGEMMNFPGIIFNIGETRQKVEIALKHQKIVDGHAPGVSGADLKTYVSNGFNDEQVRIMSDHEATSVEEVQEKIDQGMFIALRYGSATRDLDNILPGLIQQDYPLDKIMLCSDDLSPSELYERGHIDRIVLRAREIIMEHSELTLEQATLKALKMATHIPSQYIQSFLTLTHRPSIGSISKGYTANLVILDDLGTFSISSVFHKGNCVMLEKEMMNPIPTYDYQSFLKSVRISKTFSSDDFLIPFTGDQTSVQVNIIQTLKDSLLTKKHVSKLPIQTIDGISQIRGEVARDLLKIAVIERHHGKNNMTIGLIRGLGLNKGAIASTVAHDNHNLIVVGTNDRDMASLTNEMIARGGGMGALIDGNITFFPLQIGGIMSSDPLEKIIKNYQQVKKVAQEMGTEHENIFMTLSFMALAVIPELRITDMGIVDVNKFEIIDLIKSNKNGEE